MLTLNKIRYLCLILPNCLLSVCDCRWGLLLNRYSRRAFLHLAIMMMLNLCKLFFVMRSLNFYEVSVILKCYSSGSTASRWRRQDIFMCSKSQVSPLVNIWQYERKFSEKRQVWDGTAPGQAGSAADKQWEVSLWWG